MKMKTAIPAMLLVAAFLVMSSPAMASTAASPDSCASVGTALLHCYDCVNYKYLGKTSVLTNYEESGGEGYCVKASDGKTACSRAYGINQNAVGFYTEFKIGGGSRDETYDTSCINRVGRP